MVVSSFWNIHRRQSLSRNAELLECFSFKNNTIKIVTSVSLMGLSFCFRRSKHLLHLPILVGTLTGLERGASCHDQETRMLLGGLLVIKPVIDNHPLRQRLY